MRTYDSLADARVGAQPGTYIMVAGSGPSVGNLWAVMSLGERDRVVAGMGFKGWATLERSPGAPEGIAVGRFKG